MSFQHQFKKVAAMISLIAFVNFVLAAGYPAEVQAGESLTISGFGIKTAAFKPYMEEGQIAFFMNKAAAVNVELQDKNFNLVRSLAFMRQGKEGENFIAWNGRSEREEFVKSGRYIFSVTAMAEDGTSVIISKDVEIELETPEGTELKQRITGIEGKPKKEYPSKVPTKTVMGGEYGETCVLGPMKFVTCLPFAWALGTIGLLLSPRCLFSDKENSCSEYFDEWLEVFVDPFPFNKFGNREIWNLKTVDDPKEYAEIKQKIDEYNAELGVEIAEENKKIDEHNFKIKDVIVVKMKAAE